MSILSLILWAFLLTQSNKFIEYFKKSENGDSNDDKSILQGYKSVLNSKSNEESLVGKN